jgi:hypothetical protein
MQQGTKLGARIGSIFCGVPTVADDVTLISFDPFELQTMLNTQMSHANKLRYIGSNEIKVTSSATVGTPQKIEPIRAPSFSVS